MNDDDLTPARTPSAMHRLGLVPCPRCAVRGEPAPCSLCADARMVAVDVGIAWTLEHGDTDPPPPDGA